MSKRDDINELYKPSKVIARVCQILFWANVSISVIMIFTSQIVSNYLTILLIIIAFVYMLFSIFDDGILWFRAESERRKNAIQNAFEVTLSDYETEGYYNNTINDSELAYAANLFESSYFTKEISKQMIAKSSIKSIIAIIVLLVTCRFIANNELLLVISQTAFSAVIVEETIRLIIFVYRIKTLYDDVYREFITNGICKITQRVWLRWFCVEYESIKAHYRIRLDESIYNKMNPGLSERWEKISNQIKTRAK